MKQDKEAEKYNQSRRILTIYRLFQRQKEWTSNEVIAKILNKYPSYSKRSIQRDLKILADEEYITCINSGRSSKWEINKSTSTKSNPLKIQSNEVLSFHILKSYLKTFAGTTIEKDIDRLGKKLDNLFPGEIMMEEQFYADHNFGNYDYSSKHEVIRKCINFINDKSWIDITYNRIYDDKTSDYVIFPHFLFTYSGTLYLVAYNPKLKKDVIFTIQNILSIEEHLEDMNEPPEFDYKKFKIERFAVFDGEIKKIKLQIRPDFIKFFENRNWHQTQKFAKQTDGSYILSMEVPESLELVSWICRWGAGIKVLEPQDLANQVRDSLQKAYEQY